MTDKITELTPEQEKMLDTVRDEWLAHALATGPGDRAKAEAGVRAAYRSAKLPEPKFIMWVDSPMAGAIAQACAWEVVDKRPALRGEDPKVDEVSDEEYAKIAEEILDLTKERMPAVVDGNKTDGTFRERLRDWWKGRVLGASWAGYYAWLDAHERIGVKGLEIIHGQQEVAKQAGWWWACSGYAIVSARPDVATYDPQNQLHNETGPALLYPDGWGLHAWHGRRVPSWVIENPTVENIKAEENIEIRRCAIESMGWSEYIEAAGWKPLSEDDYGKLYEIEDDDDTRVCLVVNGSPERDGTYRRYGLPVPADAADTPLEAVAWSFGVEPSVYATLQRRT